MKHIEGNFKGVRQIDHYYQAWLPDGKVKAVFLIIHGLGEHSGRYGNLVDYFVPQGYALYGFDNLGHGKSGGEREVIHRFEDFTENITIFVNMIKAEQPDMPIFIYGHSMGGLIVTWYLIDNQQKFTAAIISAPLIRVPSNITPMTITVGKILSTLAPKAGIISLDATGVSRDPEVVKAYINDPLVFHGKTSARLSAEMLRAMMRVTAESDKITLPFIVIQGSGDKLVDPGDGQLLYKKASSKDKTIKIYEGLYHEVHNEPERLDVFRDLGHWLKAHS